MELCIWQIFFKRNDNFSSLVSRKIVYNEIESLVGSFHIDSAWKSFQF